MKVERKKEVCSKTKKKSGFGLKMEREEEEV